MEAKLNCIVVDDDTMSLKVLQTLVEKTDFLKFNGAYNNSIDAEKAIREGDIDLIFLDIEMPDMTGLELIKALDIKPQIILVSAKEKYALDSYEYDVADYLLKPVNNYSRFLKAAQRAHKNYIKAIADDKKENIFIKVDSLLLNFDLKNILWVEAYGDYVKINTSEKVYTVYSTLKMMEGKLPAKQFVRVHRSYIVRIDKIKNIDQGNLQIKDKIIPISNSYRNVLFERINTL